MKNMLQKKFLRVILLFALFLILPINGFSQIMGWNPSANSGTFGVSPWTPATLNANLETSGLIRGSSISTSGSPAGGAWGGSGGWSTSSNDGNSFYFTFKAKAGFKVSLSAISSATRRSNSGPTGSVVAYSVDGGAFTNLPTWTTNSTSGTTGTANSTSLSGIIALQNIAAGTVVKFRITPQGTGGNYYLTGGANSLRLEGTVDAAVTIDPLITPSVTTLAPFGDVNVGNSSTASNFTFDGVGLTDDVSVAAPAGFEISTDGNNWYAGADISPTAGTLNDVQIWVRFNPTVAGAVSGNITLSSPGADDKTIAVSGNGIQPSFLSVTPTTITSLNYTEGTGPSLAFQLTQLQASGLNPSSTYVFKTLNGLNSNYEVSTNTTDWLDSSTTIITQGGNFTIENPTFYIRLKQGLPTGMVPSETIVLEVSGTNPTLSTSITVSGMVTPSSLVAPIATAGTLPTLTNFTANWEAVNGAIEYLLDVSTSENFTTLLNNYDNLVVIGTSKLIESLEAGTTYYYRVRAKANAVISLNSNVITIKTACDAVAIPIASAQEFCGAATVNNLEATTLTGAVAKWYDTATDTIPLDPAVALTTKSYFVTQTTANGCESQKTEVAVTIKTIPELLSANPQTFCEAGTVADLVPAQTNIQPEIITETFEDPDWALHQNFSGSYPLSTGIWTASQVSRISTSSSDPYKRISFGNATGTTQNSHMISPVLNGVMSLTIEATCTITSDKLEISKIVNGVETVIQNFTVPQIDNLVMTLFTVTINDPSDLQIKIAAKPSTGTNYYVALGTLTVTSFESQTPIIKWYDVATDGTALANTESLQTGNYYVTQTVDGCESPRTEVAITVSPNVIPNFEPISVCNGSEAPVLATTSPNGITGTWSPATISNTASGDYIFTPNASECATTQTLSVVVIEKTAPNFDPIADFCSGSNAPVLEATSPNGITGTWSPATISNTINGDYLFTPNASECATTQTLSVVVIEKTVPNFAPIADFCSDSVAPVLEAISPNGITGPWNPATISNTISGDYIFTPNASECATTQTLSVVIIEKTVPNFAPIADFCSDSEAPLLATTSPNGITGTWSPATISNTISGDYIFTPDASECATTQTLSVVVIEKTAPNFAPIADFCSGSDAPVLEATSPNGITGTWSPATISNTASGDYLFTPEASECATTQTLSIVINEATNAPTGVETQDFNGGDTLSDFVVMGEGIKWYDAPTEGNELSSTDLIVAGAIYYASQTTADGCGESPERLKIIAGVDLANATFDRTTFNYYPNPVNDFLTVTSSEKFDSITVFNLLGQQLITKKVNSTSYKVDLSNLASGTYLIHAVSGKNSRAFKVIKK